MTDAPDAPDAQDAPETKDGKKKKKSAAKPNRLSFYDDRENGRLYITVIDQNNQYWFAFQGDGGKLEFAEALKISGKKILPRKIPEINGQPSEVVRVPRMDLLEGLAIPDANTLITEIERHIKRYFDAPDLEIEMFAYYVFFTWFYQKTSVAPILRLLADLGSGKSRGVTVIGDLCFYRTKLDGGSSLSSIMRLKQQWNGTVTMDEADLKQSYREDSGSYDDTLIKFLNLGYERGKAILKTNAEDHDVQEVYDPYCPKILGMRAVFRDAATESRCLSYSPRETKRKDIPNILPPSYHKETDLLVAKLARFALYHWSSVDGYDFIGFDEVSIDQRTRQLSLPLSLVIKQLFPAGELKFKRYIRTRYAEIRRQRAQSDEGIAFNTLHAIAQGEINLKEGFPKYYGNEETIPKRVTTGMMASAYGFKKSNRVTRLLTNTLHFERKKERVVDKPEWVIVVPDFETWRSAYDRYYFNETDQQITWDTPQGCPSIPAALSRSGEDVSKPEDDKDDNQGAGGGDASPPPSSEKEHSEQHNEKTEVELEQMEQHTHFNPFCSNVPDVPNTIEGVLLKNCSSSTTPPYRELEQKEHWNNISTPPELVDQDLPSLVKKYDLYQDTDVSQHTRFTKAGHKCMCLGCDKPGMWHGPDKVRPLPLCDEHYRELKAAKTAPPQE